MRTIEMETAEQQLASLVAEAEAGSEVVLARAGRPVVRLVPVEEKRRKLNFGTMEGQFHVPDDFDTMFEEEIRQMFEGE